VCLKGFCGEFLSYEMLWILWRVCVSKRILWRVFVIRDVMDFVESSYVLRNVVNCLESFCVLRVVR